MFDFHTQVNLTLSIDSILPYRHLLIPPEGTSELNLKGWNLWNRLNNFLWEGEIEQDTAEVFTNQSEVDLIIANDGSA